jgi:hypothetical protein
MTYRTTFWKWSAALVAASMFAAAPALAQTAEVSEAPTGSDHSRFVRTFAVGYLGSSELTTINPPPGAEPAAINVPVVGARYWLSNRMGIDLGIGLATGGRTVRQQNMETQTPDPFAMAFKVGVPFALLDVGHFVFELTPEAGFGFSSNTFDEMEDVDVDTTHFDVGARVGAEIHFGFIDIPQLSLQAGIGLRFSHDSGTAEIDNDEVASYSISRFATTVGDSPWALFTGNIAALYYFGR